MTWRDKLEIGLKEDAPFRRDNLPDFQVRGIQIPAGPGRSPEIPAARMDPIALGASPGEPELDIAVHVEPPSATGTVANETAVTGSNR